MAILRTARELAADKLGAKLESVGPETEIGSMGKDLLSDLFAKMEQQLAEEQGIELPPASAGDVSARLVSLGLEPNGEPPATVAEAAEIVTRAGVRMLVSNRLDVPPEELSPELSFAVDLGADSLTRVDLVLLLEEALDVAVPDDSMALVQTVGDSELFAVLFDRTREALEGALGVEGTGLAYNTPLSTVGDPEGTKALEAASGAAGLELPERQCPSLQEAVRVAFLARRLRGALANASRVEPGEILAKTMPEQDLGLTEAQTLDALRKLAAAMELTLPKDVGSEELSTFSSALQALSGPPCNVGGSSR